MKKIFIILFICMISYMFISCPSPVLEEGKKDVSGWWIYTHPYQRTYLKYDSKGNVLRLGNEIYEYTKQYSSTSNYSILISTVSDTISLKEISTSDLPSWASVENSIMGWWKYTDSRGDVKFIEYDIDGTLTRYGNEICENTGVGNNSYLNKLAYDWLRTSLNEGEKFEKILDSEVPGWYSIDNIIIPEDVAGWWVFIQSDNGSTIRYDIIKYDSNGNVLRAGDRYDGEYRGEKLEEIKANSTYKILRKDLFDNHLRIQFVQTAFEGDDNLDDSGIYWTKFPMISLPSNISGWWKYRTANSGNAYSIYYIEYNRNGIITRAGNSAVEFTESNLRDSKNRFNYSVIINGLNGSATFEKISETELPDNLRSNSQEPDTSTGLIIPGWYYNTYDISGFLFHRYIEYDSSKNPLRAGDSSREFEDWYFNESLKQGLFNFDSLERVAKASSSDILEFERITDPTRPSWK